jgi:hypothetical protein
MKRRTDSSAPQRLPAWPDVACTPAHIGVLAKALVT